MEPIKRNLLYVDDQPENLIVFRAAFEENFEIFEASSAAEALEHFDSHEIPVLLADQRMPDMTGVELCEFVRREHPHTVRMILTGYIDTDAMMNAINLGHVYGFVTKPWNRETLAPMLLRGFEAYDLALANHALSERLEHAERCAALGQCAARIAHEMRNQLFVLPLLEFIESNYAGHEELRELARIARQTHDRLNELLDDVRSFARKEDETCRKSPVNLAQVVREAVSLASMHPSVPKQGLKLQVQAEPTVVCHAIRIQQVIFNLVRNAADALKAQPCPKILVTLAEDGDRISLSVQDNGPGLDPAQLERVGEAFFTTKGGEGTGLGLDICRRIVLGHGGTLTCQSEPGQGATFIVRLPKTPPAAAAAMDLKTRSGGTDTALGTIGSVIEVPRRHRMS